MSLELQRHLHPVGHYGSFHSSSSLTGGAKGFLLQLRERIGLNGIPAEMKHAEAKRHEVDGCICSIMRN